MHLRTTSVPLYPFIFAIALTLTTPAHASMARPVVEVLEQLGKLAGRAPSRTAGEALEAAYRAQGHVALEAAQHGGLDLVEAAARHGEGVMQLATHVPEAARYVAAQPQQALALATRWGEDAVRLEARVPGMAEETARQFGRAELTVLRGAPPADLFRLNGYAAHAHSLQTKAALLQGWKREGSAFLDKLDKHKALILTTGLTLSMIKVADGMEDAIRDIPRAVPQAIHALFSRLGDGGKIALIALAMGLSLALALRVWLHRRAASSSR